MNLRKIIVSSLAIVLFVVSTQVAMPRYTEAQFGLDGLGLFLRDLNISWSGWNFTIPVAPPTPVSQVSVTAVPNKIILGGLLSNNLSLITWSAPTLQVCASNDFETGGATSGSKLVPISVTKDIKVVCSNKTPDVIVEDQIEINLAGPAIGSTGLGGSTPTGGSGGGGGGRGRGGQFNLFFAPQSAHAQATEAHGFRPNGDRKYVESPKVDICKLKPSLQTGETFYIYGDSALNGTPSSWSGQHMDIRFEFSKGTGGVKEHVNGGKKRNHFKAYYDGNCMTYFSSEYQGPASDFKDAYATYSKVGFNRKVGGDVDPSTAKSGQVRVTVEKSPLPTITFSAKPTKIISGQSVTLNWDSEHATTCSGSNFETAGAIDGSVTVPITMPAGGIRNFSLMCSGPGGIATQALDVTIGEAPLTAVRADLRAIPFVISKGDNTRLEWSSINATSCTGVGFDTGGLTAGSKIVLPSKTTTYKVTCIAGDDSVSDSLTVTVADTPITPPVIGLPPTSEDCLLKGNLVTNGSSITVYESPSVDYDIGSCRSQVRTCTNGTLSGSYGFSTCAVEGPVATDFLCSKDNNTWQQCDGQVFTLSTRNTPLYVKADNDVERWYQCGDTSQTRATFAPGSSTRTARVNFTYVVPVTAANQIQNMSFCLDAVNTPDVQKTFKIKLLDFGFVEG